MRLGPGAGAGGAKAGDLSRHQVIIKQGFIFVAEEFRLHCPRNGKLLLLVDTYELSYGFINFRLAAVVNVEWRTGEMDSKVFAVIVARGESRSELRQRSHECGWRGTAGEYILMRCITGHSTRLASQTR